MTILLKKSNFLLIDDCAKIMLFSYNTLVLCIHKNERNISFYGHFSKITTSHISKALEFLGLSHIQHDKKTQEKYLVIHY